jgi:N-acetylglucosaminyldiphosphoundecaprenol N-acetyl-beta-D-mannosaminyltransferase
MTQTFVKILGVRIDKVNHEEAYNRFLSLIKRDRAAVIYTPNSEIVMMAQNDEELKEVIYDADLVVPDGVGLIYASRIHNLGLTERVAGIELMERMLKFCHSTKKSIYLLGAKEEVVKLAAERIHESYNNIEIKGYHSGYYDQENELKIIDEINELKPDILFVAFGAPKQEKWIHKHKKILNCKVAMGVGGSFDIMSGTVKRAPKLFRNTGFEWLYRLMTNPTRFVRMLALPHFLIKVLLERDMKQ